MKDFRDNEELEIRSLSFWGTDDLSKSPEKRRLGDRLFKRWKRFSYLGNLGNERQMEEKKILNNICLTVSKGRRLSLLGPSGCGKTTLLRIIAGLEPHYEGTVHFRGKNLSLVPPHFRHFGMMFQDYALFPHRTVFKNISFGLEMKKQVKGEISRRVNEMLELVNLEGYAQREIQSLSGGERQRVALARTLAPNPHLIMLDEPLGALDRLLRERLLMDLCTILEKMNMTTIWVTHDHQEAFAASDRVCVMMNGTIAQIDSPQSLFRSPATKGVADFLGFQNIVEARYDLSDKNIRLYGTTKNDNSRKRNTKKRNIEDFYIKGLFHVPPLSINNQAPPFFSFCHDVGGHSGGGGGDTLSISQSLPSGTTPSPFQDGMMVSILLMPDAAKIVSEDAFRKAPMNGLQGRVVDLLFQGATWKITIKVNQTQLSFTFPRMSVVPEKDEWIFLKIDPHGILPLKEA